MDNRIPKVVGDFIRKPEGDTLSYLSFSDWIQLNEHRSADSIVVARSWKDESGDFYTFSALVKPAAPGMVKEILAKPDWEVKSDFGQPSFFRHGGGPVRYDRGDARQEGGLTFHPFVVTRDFHGYVPGTVELIQEFILYHNAFWNAERNEFQRVNEEDGAILSVAQVQKDGDRNKLIRVDVDHLKDFLAARGCLLVRFHDHRRSRQEDIRSKISGDFEERILRFDDATYRLWLRTDLRGLNGEPSSSRLLGKDIVPPYPHPASRHTSWATSGNKKEYLEFVLGKDASGTEILCTCDEDKLSNYFTDTGKPHFLTPVFFDRRVLAKYYSESARFTVESRYLRCLSLWGLPMDTTKEGQVQVWLGDLGHIPFAEQRHWRSHNEPPKGTLSASRFSQDFLAQFVEPENDPIYFLKKKIEELNESSQKSFGEPLLLPLEMKDRAYYRCLHVPLTDEAREFDEQVQALAKVIIEPLNVRLLERISSAAIDGKEIKGSLDLLAKALKSLAQSSDTIQQMLFPLHAIQTLRSTGAAHRKGKKFEAALKKYELDGLAPSKGFEEVVKKVDHALALLASAMASKSLE